MDDQNFLTFLKKNYPYLYKTEMSVRRVIDNTGYGDVSISLGIRGNQVYKISMIVNSEEMLNFNESKNLFQSKTTY